MYESWEVNDRVVEAKRLTERLVDHAHYLRLDAFLTCDIRDVAVCGARPGKGGAGRDDHASANLLGTGGLHLDVMHATVHPVDHQPDPLAHLVAAKPLVEHPADDALGRVLAV